MNRAMFYRRKSISFFLLFTMLFYSFFELTGNIHIEQVVGVPSDRHSQMDSVVKLNELVSSEQFVQSATQTVLERQLKSHKRNAGFYEGRLVVVLILPAFFLLFLLFLNLCCIVINCSHSFILRFIHQKDGQKA